MTTASHGERVLLVLSRSPLRHRMSDWLDREGFDVRLARAWEVGPLVDAGAAEVVVTSDELDGEWGWSARHGADVLVLALPTGRR